MTPGGARDTERRKGRGKISEHKVMVCELPSRNCHSPEAVMRDERKDARRMRRRGRVGVGVREEGEKKRGMERYVK